MVWLLAKPDPVFMLGEWRKRYCDVVIPSGDRRLVKFETILRKSGIDLSRAEGVARRALNFYVYFGTITPDCIRQCGVVKFF